MFDSVRPHGWQPTRLPSPWDSLGKNTGVGCHFLLQCMKVQSESEISQSCLTLSDPIDCSLPGSSVHGIFQARVLEWGVTTYLRLLIFLLAVLIPSCDSSSSVYHMMYSAYKLNKQEPGNGSSSPLQYSCLKNQMGEGACWATVHGVTKSWTRLSNFTFTFHFHALEKETATHSSVLAWRIPGTGEPGVLPSMGSHRVGTTEVT